ncbi:hypothetical protein [Pseudoxanthomonas sp. GW2]|uniref:hypothetical protein n=1 Tax=Pseudoxanthomonas sp. GW2 TaxID=1211114 RepID=UPI0012E99C49|nr:hypothetical protein [Pseudoxanthomonas sp. GW2]
MAVEILVEGITDEYFVRECYRRLGIEVGTVFGKRGVGYVVSRAEGFAVRGQYSPILILADFMDVDGACPPVARRELVANDYPLTLVRLAVNEIESWLLASRRELARYLGVSLDRVPEVPDDVVDPKRELVNIARDSRKPRIREIFVPKEGCSSVVGIGYVDGFQEFLTTHWSLESAVENSPSFRKFVDRSRELFLG